MDRYGNWHYAVDNSNAAVQRLAAGEEGHATYRVSSADGTPHQIRITIHGTNDAPVLTASTASATEDGAKASGRMSATEVDSSDTLTYTLGGAQPPGFDLKSDGSWTFDPTDAAYQHLSATDTQQITIPVTVTDSAHATDTQNLVITIHGTNDAARFAGATTGDVTEDNVQFSAGRISTGWNNADVTDVDGAGEEKIVGAEINGVFQAIPADFGSYLQGAHGTFQTTHSADGHDKWRYYADNSNPLIQGLKDGEQLTDSVTFVTADGTRVPVNVTIHGHEDSVIIDTPDAPTAPMASVVEDTRMTASGQLLAHDADTKDSVSFVAQTTHTAYGTFTSDAAGHWSYRLDPHAADHLAGGSVFGGETFMITARSTDGSVSTQRVQITIAGTDDAAVVTGTHTGAVTEDTALTTGGKLDITDIDSGQPVFTAGTQTGSFGALTIGADGTWSYALDNTRPDVQAMTTGDTHTEQFFVTATDPSGGTTRQAITVTINGTDDRAVIAGTSAGTVTEDSHVSSSGLLTTGGQLTISDPDLAGFQEAFQSQTGAAGTYGSFTVAPDGTWSYAADNSQGAVQALGPGQTLTDTFQVTSDDGTTHAVSVTLNGTNDAPVLTAATASATEDGQSVTGQMSATDVDTGDTLSFAPANPVPGFTLGTDGSWSFDPTDAAYQHLAAGATQQVTIPVTVTDKAGATDTENLVITVTGTNDGPVVQPGDLGATQPGAGRTLSTSDLLSVVHATDVDSGDQLSISDVQVDPQFGSFHQSGGNWVFTPAAGTSHKDVPVTISVTDGHTTSSTTATLDVTAAATPPTATQVHGSGTTHLSGTLTGGVGGWAIDNGHGQSTLSLQGQYGTLTINPQTGHFDYHYQAQSAVIKQGGSGATSGRHTDTFHILQHGTHTSDADVQVNINVQSVHGNSGHHVDHTTLMGIDIVPVAPTQHDAPDDAAPTFEVTLDSGSQDLTADALGLSDLDGASVAARADSADAPDFHEGKGPEVPDEHLGESVHSPHDSDLVNPYLDAIGANQQSDTATPSQDYDHANPYITALGVDASMSTDAPVVDPTTLDDPVNAEVPGSDAASDHAEADLPPDDPIVPLPEDDDPSTNSG
ncbi:hypothetical protein TRL7639_04189 [Falsiruegeria litorea R37]|uniref:Dystroglycan-type cadherin-like domain-containing protein n=2 Tax=Falsiruegeria litorea TaxID=1280831 RepID=A0A1Y5TS89_9RHOB|nr:hypothetical protein TRL7639_04189 [Falsiruegeria litorea R37]